MADKLTSEQEARKTYLFFKQTLTPEEEQELHALLGTPELRREREGRVEEDSNRE